MDRLRGGNFGSFNGERGPQRKQSQPNESALTYAAFKEHFLEISCPKETNFSPDAPKSCSSAFSITSCVKCLESIQGIGSSTYIKAVKMFKDVEWREVFMAMSAERRLDWLASLD